jgi:hypothetical protein
MIKYVTNILKLLTPAQRILGLFMLLLTITLIGIGPQIITALSSDCKTLEVRVNTQDSIILKLNKRVGELSNEIIDNQTECTDKLLKKQKEIFYYVDSIIREAESVTKTIKIKSNNSSNSNFPIPPISEDTFIPIKKYIEPSFMVKLKMLRQKLKKESNPSN